MKMWRGISVGVVILGLAGVAAQALDSMPEQVPVPADNPMSETKVSLGKQLFFDGRLSRNGKVSCNSCHDVSKGGVDNLSFSVGHDGKKGGRNAPTVWNAAFQSVQFWDGRAASLEDQAKGPMVNPVEMGMANHDAVVSRLTKVPGYITLFKAVFPGDGPSLTIDNAAKAIAAYERTLITRNSPYDRFAKGETAALSAGAQRGFKLVQEVGCMTCHMGPNFSGPTMPVGTGFYQKFPTNPNTAYDKKYGFSKDLGRFEFTKKDEDKHMFRVPTWRNVARTAPYFHNGAVKTLDEAVKVMAKTQLNRDLKPAETKDIVEFLTALNGELPKQDPPELPKDGM